MATSSNEPSCSAENGKSQWERSYEFVESENTRKPRHFTVKVTTVTNSELQMAGKMIETLAKEIVETKVVLIKSESAEENDQSDPESSSLSETLPSFAKQGKLLWKCSYCAFGSDDAEIYADHVDKWHISKCPHCDYTSKRRDNMKVHMYRHTGEKPHSCLYCDYRCITSANMKVHIRIHTGEKKYSCTICDFKCTQKSSLNTHMNVHSKIRPHACTECGFKTKTNGNLMIHMRTHSGEKMFACTMCPKSFTRIHNLKVHKLNHTDDKPFACKQCSYYCTSKLNLEKHLKNKH